MDRTRLSIAFAAPLAVAGLACAWMLLAPRHAPLAIAPPAAVEHCQRAAELLYEINWAAACLRTADDSTDCMLPNPEAARVNAILAAEEKRCMAVEMRASASR